MALATPKKVITHVPCEEATPRFPAMVGRATLAMVESSTVMAVTMEMPRVAMTSIPPCNGGMSCDAALMGGLRRTRRQAGRCRG